jgi:rod shape-determining protein MreC
LRDIHYNLNHQAEPAFFARGPSPIARLVFFSALSLTLIATDSQLKYLDRFRHTLETYLHPLEMMANTPAALYRQVDEYFSSHHHLLDENQHLKTQLLKSRAELQTLKILASENDHLRQLIDVKAALPQQSVMGEILYVSRDRFSKKVIINRGSNHQVTQGSAVMDGGGMVGQVTRVFPHTSVVTLVTDKSLEVPVQVERNGLRAIAFGHGQNNVIEIPFLPTNVDIKKGDVLVTSGIDGMYPAGVSVAVVSSIEIVAGSPFARIICSPTGGVESHRQILVVGQLPLPTSEIIQQDEREHADH